MPLKIIFSLALFVLAWPAAGAGHEKAIEAVRLYGE
jgi:hypothetical protein